MTKNHITVIFLKMGKITPLTYYRGLGLTKLHLGIFEPNGWFRVPLMRQTFCCYYETIVTTNVAFKQIFNLHTTTAC